MHRIIAQSGGWQEPDDARQALRGQIAKKRQFNVAQIANINKAVAGGGNFRSLLTTREKLKKEVDALRQERQNVEAEIEQMTMKRPTAEQALSQWSQLLPLWKDAMGEERQRLMGCIVRNVEIKQKRPCCSGIVSNSRISRS